MRNNRWRHIAIFCASLIVFLVTVKNDFLATSPLNGSDTKVARQKVVAQTGTIADASASIYSERARIANPSETISLITQIKRYDVNFPEMLATIRAQCPSAWGATQCNEMTRNFLRDTTPGGDAEKTELLALFDQYSTYENYSQRHPLPATLDWQSSYQAMQQIRKNFFDETTREWLFGADDARVAWERALQTFLESDAANLPTTKRLQRLEQLRRESLGKYYNLFVVREDPEIYRDAQEQVLALKR